MCSMLPFPLLLSLLFYMKCGARSSYHVFPSLLCVFYRASHYTYSFGGGAFAWFIHMITVKYWSIRTQTVTCAEHWDCMQVCFQC